MQKASTSWQEAKDWQWQEACRRETVIRPLAEQGRVSRQQAAAAAERLGVGLSLLYELVPRFRRRRFPVLADRFDQSPQSLLAG